MLKKPCHFEHNVLQSIMYMERIFGFFVPKYQVLKNQQQKSTMFNLKKKKQTLDQFFCKKNYDHFPFDPNF